MSREKQIAEMAQAIVKEVWADDENCRKHCEGCDCFDYRKAEILYNAGFRKQSEIAKLEQDVARLEQEKDELVRKIFEELGDYAADFVAGHIDDDNFLRAIYTLKAKYTNPVQCRDCAHLMFSDCYGECSKGHRGIVKPDDSCEFGEKFRREGRNE